MLPAKFQDHSTLGSEEDIKRFWPYLGMAVILVMLPRPSLHNLCSLFPRRLHIKFGLDWLYGFREKDV